jgi:hypothetical protein
MKSSLFLLGSLAAILLLGACSTGKPETAIRKVQIFHMKSDRPPATADPMIVSETRKRMWGAISPSERRARIGNYYAAHWRAAQPGQPATVRLEFRQANTGSKTHVQEVALPAAGARNVTNFNIIGEAYQTGGRVVAWRLTVAQGDQLIGEESSFLWN